MSNELGNKIAREVIKTFNDLKIKSGKPTQRSNGVKEWTVLASIVALISNNEGDDFELYPVTLTTGVKALPNKTRSYSQGLIVHDLHAEILSLRLFNWYLLDEIEKLITNTEYKCMLIEKTPNGFKLKSHVKLALFITEPPCGDASMKYLSSNAKDNKPWQDDEENARKKQKLDVQRGRNNFDRLGIVRTKPGRSDSLITLSKSCSDKLCLRQLMGICNCFTANLFGDNPIYLDYLVVKNINIDDFNRCFHTRFNIPSSKYLELIRYDGDDYEYHKPASEQGEEMSPSQLSLLYLIPTKTVQVLNNGVKNGAFVKNKPPRKGGESFICNQSLVRKLNAIAPVNFKDYSEFKRSNIEREKAKKLGQETLGNWVPTDTDNFMFHF
ncbi:uncharacterized protein SPAPADRAFT_63824 [Spathaspora passalidarum NRRL Y-27907]|uniref:A to I editase domain-containing protein n=1 Tax=Spathaspora passalidarum (strain NRRL Y-27907 / 11-Y1) TaxID=619300 RepID=G3AVP7_SPAPN|nr:uncharacterized protein SPAPADRAFT_63824 [Spathaspora passalidarum NRRL Y-27907]EGW30211.1 hypothetical protein SPAPADRAFT_63824 [Spathaspora passalidarum NRRL Y-27907]